MLKDAAGNEVLSLSNARIAVDGKFAFASRNGAFDLDNFKADYIYDEVVEATPENTPSDASNATPEETASLAPIQTTGPSEESKGPSATDNGTEDGASRSYVWLIIVIAVAVLAAVVVVVIIRSRKKSA